MVESFWGLVVFKKLDLVFVYYYLADGDLFLSVR